MFYNVDDMFSYLTDKKHDMNTFELLREAYLNGVKAAQTTEAMPANFNLRAMADSYALDKVEELNISGVIARCDCKGDEIGTYTKTIPIVNPFTNKIVDIDKCIVSQILGLWHKGIVTIESCCGHNKLDGYIAVEKQFEKQMLDLGFEPDNRTDCPACFLIRNNVL